MGGDTEAEDALQRKLRGQRAAVTLPDDTLLVQSDMLTGWNGPNLKYPTVFNNVTTLVAISASEWRLLRCPGANYDWCDHTLFANLGPPVLDSFSRSTLLGEIHANSLKSLLILCMYSCENNAHACSTSSRDQGELALERSLTAAEHKRIHKRLKHL